MERFAHLSPWTLSNEVVSMKGVNYWERVTWPGVSYFNVMAHTKAVDGSKLALGVAQFGERKHPQGVTAFSRGRL
jgi:hypothetical protein